MIFKKSLGILLVCAIIALVLPFSITASNKVMEAKNEGEVFDSHMDKGVQHYSGGRYQEALTELLLADRIMILPFTKYWIGKAYLNLKKLAEAEDFFDQAIRYYESDAFMMERYYAEACAEKAFLLYKKGEYQEARSYLEIALEKSDDKDKKIFYAVVITAIDGLLEERKTEKKKKIPTKWVD